MTLCLDFWAASASLLLPKGTVAQGEPLRLVAAGSLTASLGEVAQAC